MFGIGTTEFLVILLVGVLVLGPEHLPKIMRTITKVMSDFRRVSTDFQRTINLEANQEDWQREQSAKKTRKKKKPRPAPVPDIAAEDAVPAEPAAQTTVTNPAGTPAAVASEPPDRTHAAGGAPSPDAPAIAADDTKTTAQDTPPRDIAAEDAAPSREPDEPPLQGGSA